MNNRIMAMLFALVAAMFISIVPVKAEAACNHGNTEWKTDAYKHWQVCKTCGDVTVNQESHDDLVYSTKDATNHTVKCRTCGYTADVAHVPVKDGTNCRCSKCGVLIDHTLSWSTTGGTHKKVCDVCDYEETAADHSWTTVDEGNGKHTKTCSVCEKVVTEDHADSAADKDCVCDACGVPVETNHSPVEVAGKAATCTEAGVSGHLKCQYCGKLFSKSTPGKVLTEEDVVIKALGHKAYTTWLKTEDGKGHYHMCQNTGCEEKLEYAEHTAGTYNHDAKQHWATCSVCKADLEKADHAWTYEHINYTQTHKVKCSVCKIGESTKDCKDENKDCFCDDCGGLMFHNKADMEYLCKTPTCTESGWYENWQCKTCGTRFNRDNAVVAEADVFRAALGHKAKTKLVHNAEEHYNECENAGCKEKLNVAAHTMVMKPNDAGSHHTVCEVCGRIPADTKYVAHVDSNKDCVCDDCGFEKIHTRDDLIYHSSVKATCTVAGRVGHFSCKTCGKLFDGNKTDGFKPYSGPTVREPLGHDLGNTAVGTTADGLHQMKCSRCDLYEARNHYSNDGDCICDVAGCNTPAHSHKLVFVAGKAATCTEAGAEAYYKYEGCGKMFDLYQNPIAAAKVIPATDHDFGDWTPCEGGVHAKFCANCDEFISEEHSFKNGNVQCTVCGGEEELTHVAAKAATCTEPGNVEYWYSKITGKMYADAAGAERLEGVRIDATGHAMSGWKNLADDSLDMHDEFCMNYCGHIVHERHDYGNSCFCSKCTSVKPDHTMVMVEAVPATCGKAGTQAHFKCSCGKLYDLGFNAIEKAGSIAQLKHVMNTEVKKDAKLGKHYIECKNCDYKMYEEHAMVVSDPNKGNYHQRLCECGELEIETHYDKNGDNKCDVCDHNLSSNTSVEVEQHDNKTVYTGQSETVKPTKNWWWNWQESFTPSNSGGTTATTEKATESTNTGSTATGNATTNAPAAGTNNTTNVGTSGNAGTTGNGGSTTVTAPSANQANVLVQFINWFLGLFGF